MEVERFFQVRQIFHDTRSTLFRSNRNVGVEFWHDTRPSPFCCRTSQALTVN